MISILNPSYFLIKRQRNSHRRQGGGGKNGEKNEIIGNHDRSSQLLGKYADGNGLYLFVLKVNRGAVYRYQVAPTKTGNGTGKFHSVPKDTRLKRDRLKVQVNDGFDPLENVTER